MSRRIKPISTIAVATALGGVGCGGDDEEAQTIKLFAVEDVSREFAIDNVPGRAPGDQFGFVNQVQEDGEGAGTVFGLCTAAAKGEGPYVCDINLELEQGTLAVSGRGDADSLEGAITGGTGEFEKAAGTFSADLTKGRGIPLTVNVIE